MGNTARAGTVVARAAVNTRHPTVCMAVAVRATVGDLADWSAGRLSCLEGLLASDGGEMRRKAETSMQRDPSTPKGEGAAGSGSDRDQF